MHVAGTCAVLLTSLFTTVVTTTAASPAHATLHPLPIFLAPGAPALYPTVRIAIGVVSAPGRDALRREARQTWLAHRFVPPELAVRFVMQVSAADCARILAEGYEDVLLVDHDAADTSRAAWRKQWVWLEYAVRAFPNATHILHAEDDTYLNLAVISRAIASPLFQSGAGALHVAGQLEAFSWVPALGCPVGWSTTLNAAAGTYRTACSTPSAAPCFGPFVFAGFFFVMLSTPLVRALLASDASLEAADARSPACARDAAQRWLREQPKRAKSLSLNKFGGTLSDDIWLGYAIRKYLAALPVVYLMLQEPLLSGSWFSRGRVHRATMAMHDRLKTGLAGAKATTNESGPVDAGWSRVRRAHAFSRRFGCTPQLKLRLDRHHTRATSKGRPLGAEANRTAETAAPLLAWPVAWQLHLVQQATALNAIGVRVLLWIGSCEGAANMTAEVRTKYSIANVLDAGAAVG